MAMEAKKYPISGVMFHPETQQLRVYGDDKNALRGRVDNDTTDAINFYFSYWVNESAKKNINSHKFKDPAAALKKTLKNTPKSLTNIYSSQTLTFGFYSSWIKSIDFYIKYNINFLLTKAWKTWLLEKKSIQKWFLGILQLIFPLGLVPAQHFLIRRLE